MATDVRGQQEYTATEPQPYLLTVAGYEQMAEAGVFDEDDRVELIEGELLRIAAMGTRYTRCVNRLSRLLGRLLPDEFTVSTQNAIRLSTNTMPQPDVAIYRDDEDDEDFTPTPADVLLLVEVADSTRFFDRNRKLPLYAREGIVEFWLFDLVAGVVERYTEPVDGSYRQLTTVRPGETLTATMLPNVNIPVARILKTPR